MRLIDADYLVNVMIHNRPIEEGGIPIQYFATHNRILAFYPTIDAVPVDKIQFTDLYLDGSEAIAVFKFCNQGITLRKKCEEFAPVVRCKDCKYEEDCMKQQTLWRRNPVLELNEYEYKKVDFCSAGERKDDAENH